MPTPKRRHHTPEIRSAGRQGLGTYAQNPMANHPRVFGRGSPRKELFADETPTHVPANDNKHLSAPVGVNGTSVSPSLIGGNHIDEQ